MRAELEDEEEAVAQEHDRRLEARERQLGARVGHRVVGRRQQRRQRDGDDGDDEQAEVDRHPLAAEALLLVARAAGDEGAAHD